MFVGSKWQESEHSRELLFSSSFLLPEEIKAIIKDSGVSRDYLAEKLGISYNHLARIINNVELRQSKPVYEHGIRWVISEFARIGDGKDQE